MSQLQFLGERSEERTAVEGRGLDFAVVIGDDLALAVLNGHDSSVLPCKSSTAFN